ncbi:MAG: hypothetical protein FWF25_07250 [Propionibacteriaceae bacterium]|nr:hypothetical protein [Propionibacteriaceae bacterium]
MPMVVLPANSPVLPEPHEVEAAWILARHFGAVVEFLRPSEGYKMRTADMVMNGLIWEIKSPTGSGRTTIANQFRRASKQSSHLVFDARRVHLGNDIVLAQVRKEMVRRRHIRTVLFIAKDGTVLEVGRTQW